MTSLRERQQRVAQGSRRKRDLNAVAEAQAQAQPHQTALRSARPSEKATTAWTAALTLLADRVRYPDVWLEPLVCKGESGNALCLEAPPPLVNAIRRHHGKRIGNAVREVSEYRGCFIGTGEKEGDGCL